ncbi:Wall-associated receptor kinase 2 [Heracleum sosnowskyi]|uniref:Wall-associated receptor kinase 2 n=1 Tax=Heracleum sosnowskyi TaxID=360622 RepID=A0AAD8J985_9APIA|nr:Wall-associated receptor kinase 2 [Heracleum sosnowskyi]
MKAGGFVKPGCQIKFGSLDVPYPFGIILEWKKGPNCSMDNWFGITCNSSTNLPKAFFHHSNIEIFDISDTKLRIGNYMAERCYNQSGYIYRATDPFINLGGTSTFSDANVLTVVGCNDYGNIYQAKDDLLPKGYNTTCHNAEEVLKHKCSGTGCCQVSVNVHKYFDISLNSYDNHTSNMSYSPCGYAFYGEKNAFKFGGFSDLNDTAFVNKTIATIPIVLDWVIAENITCAQASQDSKSYACRYNNSQCIDIKPGRIFGGYRCSCKQGNEGNPYLSPGSKDKLVVVLAIAD